MRPMRLEDFANAPEHIKRQLGLPCEATNGKPPWASEDRPQKYNAEKTEVDGVTFASKAEAARWRELQLLERAGEIEHLRHEAIRFILGRSAKGRLTWYKPDFTYIDLRKGSGYLVAEDFKGCAARDWPVRSAAFKRLFPEWELRVSRRIDDAAH